MQVWIATSKTGLDINNSTLCIEFFSQFAKQLRTFEILVNYKNWLRAELIAHSLPSRNDLPAIAAKNNVKGDMKAFCSWLIFLIFLSFTQNFIRRSGHATKKRLWNRCFPINFDKVLRIAFLKEHLRWLPQGIISTQGWLTVCLLLSQTLLSFVLKNVKSIVYSPSS